MGSQAHADNADYTAYSLPGGSGRAELHLPHREKNLLQEESAFVWAIIDSTIPVKATSALVVQLACDHADHAVDGARRTGAGGSRGAP